MLSNYPGFSSGNARRRRVTRERTFRHRTESAALATPQNNNAMTAKLIFIRSEIKPTQMAFSNSGPDREFRATRKLTDAGSGVAKTSFKHPIVAVQFGRASETMIRESDNQ